jgi:hypothetical protein
VICVVCVVSPTEMVSDMRGMRGKWPTEMVSDMRGMRGKSESRQGLSGIIAH